MFEILSLALALSMDAFAVSIGIGTKVSHKLLGQAIKAALLFGFFQGGMTFAGYFAGVGLLGWIESYFNIISFILLLFIGAKMIYEGMSEGIEEEITKVSNRVLLILAIATSIDALAVGFTLTVSSISILTSSLIIAIVTLILSLIGVYIGKIGATWLEGKAEIFGGICLILIGIKSLVF
jgi:putative Mn2+ efflux pump MntP